MYEQLFVQTSSILYATRSAKQPFSLSHYLVVLLVAHYITQ